MPGGAVIAHWCCTVHMTYIVYAEGRRVNIGELSQGACLAATRLGLKQSSPVLSPPSPKLGLGLQSHLNYGPSVF